MLVAARELDGDEGPVLVTLEYDVDPDRPEEFMHAVRGLEPVRRRDGAIRWSVYHDGTDPRGDVLEASRRRAARAARERPRTIDAHLEVVGDAVVQQKPRNGHVDAGAMSGPQVSVARTSDPVEPVRRVEFQRACGRGVWDVREQRELLLALGTPSPLRRSPHASAGRTQVDDAVAPEH